MVRSKYKQGLKVSRNQIFASIFGIITFLSIFNNVFILNIYPFLKVVQLCTKLIIVAVLLLYIVLIKKNYSKTMIFASVLIVWNLFSALINGNSMIDAIGCFSGMYLVCLSLESMKNEKQILYLLKMWMVLIFLLVLIDLYTEVKYPQGLYAFTYSNNNWFLGYKTERLIISLPMVMICVLLSQKEKNKITLGTYLVILITLIDVYLSNATGGLIAFIVILLFVVLLDLLNRGKLSNNAKIFSILLDYKIVMVFYVIAFAVVVIMQNAKIISGISEFFGKHEGLSYRDTIWKACIESISHHWLIGVGYLNGANYEKLTKLHGGSNAHNMFLTILMHGGVIALIIYMTMVYKIMKNTNKKSNEIKILTIFVYAMFILGFSSSAIVYSNFELMFFWLIEYMKNQEKKKIETHYN